MRKLLLFLMTAAAFGQVLVTNPANTAFKPTPANPYYPALAGLRLVIAGGSFVNSSTNAVVTLPQQTIFLPDNSNNFVYLLPSSGVITSNTIGFPSSSYPIAIAPTSGGQIGALKDSRPDVQPGGGIGSLPTAAAGSVLASQGVGITSALQTKPTVDVRDSASGFDCTGTNAMDTGMQAISSTAHIIVPFGCVVKLASAHTYTQTFEFKQGGQLAPTTGTLITLTGPIIAGSYQIFSNALATQGGIDFTGNNNTFDVLPEWWGASTTASAATNTTALQAAIYGAFGCNTSPVTTCRTNGAGTSFYNKRLFLKGQYTISGELHWYHTLNFVVEGAGRLLSGIVQSAANSRIIDGQSNAYGVFRDLSFSATVNTQDLNHPLVDLNFDGSQGTDLKPQFIDFYNISWSGGGLAKIGVRIAAAGGGAQGSNINFYNNSALSFTEAAYMIGSGSGCTATTLATNAISIIWKGGDMQSNFAYGVEDFGGTNLDWDGGTAENGSDIALGGTNQTGADFCATSLNAGGGPFTIRNMRSESQVVMTGPGPWALYNVRSADSILVPGPGNTPQVGDLIEGSVPCSHGLWNKITASAGVFSGLGTVSTPRSASGGSATTLVDSVGGLTVNAWTGFNVCLQGGTGVNEFATITSNTATTFTFTGGLKTDFPTNGVVAPDATTTYTVEPNWGTATTDGGATFAVDNTTYSGIAVADTVFFPGKRFLGNNGARLSNVQLTRNDWAGTVVVDGITSPLVTHVDVGSPIATGTGSAQLALSQNFPLIRTYTLPRASLTEQAFFLREELGTRTLHWFGGTAGGASSTIDIYTGADSNLPTTNAGDWFISNNSSNTPQKWTFNSNGTANFPAAIIGGGTSSVACTNPTNGYALIGGSNNNTNITSFGSNGIDFCANGSRVATVFPTAFAIDGTANIGYNGGKGQHFVTFAAGNDTAGTCTAAAAATCTVTFTTAYASAPACTVTDQTNITTVKALPSTTTLVITTAAATSDVFSYICIGNPN